MTKSTRTKTDKTTTDKTRDMNTSAETNKPVEDAIQDRLKETQLTTEAIPRTTTEATQPTQVVDAAQTQGTQSLEVSEELKNLVVEMLVKQDAALTHDEARKAVEDSVATAQSFVRDLLVAIEASNKPSGE